MAAEKSKMIRLGLFVIIALILLVIGVYNVGSKKNLFGSTIEISSEFENINGLLAGNNVRYSGMVVGSVSSISIKNDGVLVVNMQIDNTLNEYIKKDALVSISPNGLVGDKVVNIIPGHGNEPHIEDGDILRSKETVEVQNLLAILDKSNDNIQEITAELLQITKKINAKNGLVMNLLHDDGISNSIKLSAQNIEKMSDDLLAMTDEVNKVLVDLNAGKGTLGYLLKDNTLQIKTNKMLDDIDREVISKTGLIMSDIESSAKSIHSVSHKVDSLINKIDLDNSMLGLLLQDSASAHKTELILDSIQISAELFNENMEALQHNFLFRRYFKKKRKKELSEAKK